MNAMPSAIHKDRVRKFEAPMQPAIFLGYVVQDGGKWFGEYLWAFLDDFADRSFYRRARWSECGVTIHSGREMRFDGDGPSSSRAARSTSGTMKPLRESSGALEREREAEALEDGRPEIGDVRESPMGRSHR